MESHRFDDLTRSLVASRSRRSFVGALVGAFVALADGPVRAGADRRCLPNQERCGGRCRRACPRGQRRDRRTCECECVRKRCTGGKELNHKTCRCECPDDMHDCGDLCVRSGRCCPGEKTCGGGCIREEDCCPRTHKECPDGSCLEKGTGACCPGTEVSCPVDPAGCCNSLAGEECSDEGCCDTLLGGKTVCAGKCVDTATDPSHCGGCGNACGANEVCQGGTCVCGPGSPTADGVCCPANETPCGDGCCAEGQCSRGRCCPAGREACPNFNAPHLPPPNGCCPPDHACCGFHESEQDVARCCAPGTFCCTGKQGVIGNADCCFPGQRCHVYPDGKAQCLS